MNGYNFTERVRMVLAAARDESARLHHEYVGTEHILFALLRVDDGVATAVLANLNIDVGGVRQMLDHVVVQGKQGKPAGVDLPYTSRAKKLLELSMVEAKDLGHNYVGTEHLLLAMLREEKGIAASHFIRRNEAGEVLLDTRQTDFSQNEPQALWGAALPLHTVENVGEATLHVVSVEVKSPIWRGV